MNEIPIYTITPVTHLQKKYREDGSSYEMRDTRTVGFFYDYDTAENTVTSHNGSFLNEAGYYPYVVIESHYEGMYAYEKLSPSWFRWYEGEYIKVDMPPSDLENIIAFGIG